MAEKKVEPTPTSPSSEIYQSYKKTEALRLTAKDAAAKAKVHEAYKAK
jgi:hypothetical protein